VKNVYCVVIFANEDRQPVDSDVVHFPGTIGPGLARRVSGKVDASVPRLTRYWEVRVLDFQIAD
jgi:hypothetical protein